MPGVLGQGVFLSYRREDTGPYARSLQLQLGQRVPDALIFMDLDSIEAGLDFAEVIEDAVNSCAVLVALIGRQWATLTDEDGSRRLDNPDDFVRFEVKTALERGLRVIPVLIDGARPVRQQELPDDLRKLARLNAHKLSWDRYQDDADRLLDIIQKVLAAERVRQEAERKASEEAERKREEAELATATPSSTDDPLPEALGLAEGARHAGLGLKLLGGLAVRVLCPDYPPRLRRDQDIDFACLSRQRHKVAAYLADRGCEPDRRFTNLNSDRQMYFISPSGRPIDVIVDRLTMCHTLDLRPSFDRLPLTIDAVDVLLSKLQIVELNEKHAQDIVHLLAALPLGERDPSRSPRGSFDAKPSIDTHRFTKLLGADWGWWRTVTCNLEKLPALIVERPDLVPPGAAYDPVAQSKRLIALAEETPKLTKWTLRAKVGERVRWYDLPEEGAH